MDLVLAGKDNIDPAVLFNSETDFSEFDFSFEDPASTNTRTTTQVAVETAEPSKRNGRTKKRSRNTDSSELIELFTNKWEKEMVAEREERQAFKKQKEERKQRQEEQK